MYITTGTFTGMTINELLEEANNFIGGCASTYSASTLNDALTAFNENYDNGTIDNGFLNCTLANDRIVSVTLYDGIKAYPVPANNEIFIQLNNQLGSIVTVSIFDLTGKLLMKTATVDYASSNLIRINTNNIKNQPVLIKIDGEKGVKSIPVLILHN